jgi:cysteine desulfurase/selenocysteine lyase
MEYLNKIGMEDVRQHEVKLTKYALESLAKDKHVTVYGPGIKDIERKAGVIAFNIDGAHAHDVAYIFDSEGIAIRSGHHCAMPLVTKILKVQSTPRISFYLYNTEEDVDKVISTISTVRKTLKLQ